MSTSPNITRSEIACKLRSLADELRECDRLDMYDMVYALFDAFGVAHCSVHLAFEIIAAYVDPEGEVVYCNDEIDTFISELYA